MTIDVTHEELVKLVKGLSPRTYTEAIEYERRGYGRLSGFPNERWFWNETKLRITSDQLLIQMMKELLQETN